MNVATDQQIGLPTGARFSFRNGMNVASDHQIGLPLSSLTQHYKAPLIPSNKRRASRWRVKEFEGERYLFLNKVLDSIEVKRYTLGEGHICHW